MLIADLGDGAALHLLELRHAPAYHQLILDNLERMYWLPLAPPPTSADSERRIRSGLERLAHGTGLEAGIFDGGVLVGGVGLFGVSEEFQSGEIGYWIDKRAEGRGLVTRAARAILRYAFETLALHRVELRCSGSNTRSQAVAQRLGFRLEGRQVLADRTRNGWEDFLLYGILEEEYHGNSGRP